MVKEQIKTLDDLIRSDGYQIYESETLLNIQYHIINNTDINVDEMIEANANGCFGVSHSDFIECWREYLGHIIDDENIAESVGESISQEIDDCENWHSDNSSLYDII